jgi:hypothetical protein
MSAQAVLLGGATFFVPKRALVTNCPKFLDNPDLLKSPYRIGSQVGGDSLKMFLAALDGTEPELTVENMNDHFLLCQEFGFAALLSQVSDSGRSTRLLTKSISAFAGLKSKTYSKIEYLVSCRRRFRICGWRIPISRKTIAHLGR